MEVVSLGQSDAGYPVVLDKHASEADHIAVVGRVKPHTGFHGPIESGLCKMMMIGLGKHIGALAYHRILLDEPYDTVVRGVARMRWGDRLEYVAEADAGDFIFVPPYVPHQEINRSSDTPLECVLVRSDNEAVVVNLNIDAAERVEEVYWIDPIHRGVPK